MNIPKSWTCIIVILFSSHFMATSRNLYKILKQCNNCIQNWKWKRGHCLFLANWRTFNGLNIMQHKLSRGLCALMKRSCYHRSCQWWKFCGLGQDHIDFILVLKWIIVVFIPSKRTKINDVVMIHAPPKKTWYCMHVTEKSNNFSPALNFQL